MSLTDILNLDCRNEDEMQELQEVLHKIKPFKNVDGDIPIDKLEKLIKIVSDKYDIWVNRILCDPWANDTTVIWRVVITDRKNLKSDWITYGTTLYEAIAKACVQLWDIVQKRSKKK